MTTILRYKEGSDVSRCSSNLDVVTFFTLLFVFVVSVACIVAGCVYDTDTEKAAHGPTPPAQGVAEGQDLDASTHTTQSSCPPAARLEHSKGNKP